MAEWSCSGLQSRVRRFDSDSRLSPFSFPLQAFPFRFPRLGVRVLILRPRASSPIGLAVTGWLLLSLAGALVLVRIDIAARREAFQVEARAMHRTLGQLAAQNDAILVMLGLMQVGRPASGLSSIDVLPGLYPQVVAVSRRRAGEPCVVG